MVLPTFALPVPARSALKGRRSIPFVAAIVLFGICAHSPDCQGTAADSDVYLQALQYSFESIIGLYVDQPDPETIFGGAIKGMIDALGDKRSAILSEGAARNIADISAGAYGGIGIGLTKRPTEPAESLSGDRAAIPGADGDFEVNVLVEGAPAARAGVRIGDSLVAIGGESTTPLTRDEVSRLLRGLPGSAVSLSLEREGRIIEVLIVRELVEAMTVKALTLSDGSGYLRISAFAANTATRVEEALARFVSEDARALVLDLRGNPGGLLGAAVNVADLFLSSGIIVRLRSRASADDSTFLADQAVAFPRDLPLAVLVDGGSASAAEVLAGALRDNGRAVVIGERTIGKGSVQRALLFDRGGIKITVSRYLTPGGADIEGIGIVPDQETHGERSPGDTVDPETDPALREALAILSSDRYGRLLKPVLAGPNMAPVLREDVGGSDPDD